MSEASDFPFFEILNLNGDDKERREAGSLIRKFKASGRDFTLSKYDKVTKIDNAILRVNSFFSERKDLYLRLIDIDSNQDYGCSDRTAILDRLTILHGLIKEALDFIIQDPKIGIERVNAWFPEDCDCFKMIDNYFLQYADMSCADATSISPYSPICRPDFFQFRSMRTFFTVLFAKAYAEVLDSAIDIPNQDDIVRKFAVSNKYGAYREYFDVEGFYLNIEFLGSRDMLDPKQDVDDYIIHLLGCSGTIYREDKEQYFQSIKEQLLKPVAVDTWDQNSTLSMEHRFSLAALGKIIPVDDCYAIYNAKGDLSKVLSSMPPSGLVN